MGLVIAHYCWSKGSSSTGKFTYVAANDSGQFELLQGIDVPDKDKMVYWKRRSRADIKEHSIFFQNTTRTGLTFVRLEAVYPRSSRVHRTRYSEAIAIWCTWGGEDHRLVIWSHYLDGLIGKEEAKMEMERAGRERAEWKREPHSEFLEHNFESNGRLMKPPPTASHGDSGRESNNESDGYSVSTEKEPT